MKYELVYTEDGGRIESDGNVIWESKEGLEYPNADALEAILEDSNFGQPQKDALRAIVGIIDRRDETR